MFGERFHAGDMPEAGALRKPDEEAAKGGEIFFWPALRRGFNVGAQSHQKTRYVYGYRL
jgi:hypothetical protein